MARVSGIIPFSSVRVLLPALDGMAGSGQFLVSIQDKSIHLVVFEKCSKEMSVIRSPLSILCFFRTKAVNNPSRERKYKVQIICSLNFAPAPQVKRYQIVEGHIDYLKWIKEIHFPLPFLLNYPLFWRQVLFRF
jgi:hypothetical protein